jgi:hypothetical protein
MELFDLAEGKDDRFKALNLIIEAWDQGADLGITPELMAYAALFTALSDLVGVYGEERVARLAQGLVERIERGEFTMHRVMQ